MRKPSTFLFFILIPVAIGLLSWPAFDADAKIPGFIRKKRPFSKARNLDDMKEFAARALGARKKNPQSALIKRDSAAYYESTDANSLSLNFGHYNRHNGDFVEGEFNTTPFNDPDAIQKPPQIKEIHTNDTGDFVSVELERSHQQQNGVSFTLNERYGVLENPDPDGPALQTIDRYSMRQETPSSNPNKPGSFFESTVEILDPKARRTVALELKVPHKDQQQTLKTSFALPLTLVNDQGQTLSLHGKKLIQARFIAKPVGEEKLILVTDDAHTITFPVKVELHKNEKNSKISVDKSRESEVTVTRRKTEPNHPYRMNFNSQIRKIDRQSEAGIGETLGEIGKPEKTPTPTGSP